MTEYRVKWEIEIDADSPEEAAKEALKIQRNVDSIATVFEITCENEDKRIIDITYNVEYCAICERNEINNYSPLIQGIDKVCHDCCNKYIEENGWFE